MISIRQAIEMIDGGDPCLAGEDPDVLAVVRKALVEAQNYKGDPTDSMLELFAEHDADESWWAEHEGP